MKEYLLKINNEGYKADFKYKDFELEVCEGNLFNFNIDIYVEDALEIIDKKIKMNWLNKNEKGDYFIDEIIKRGSNNPLKRIDKDVGSYNTCDLLTKVIEQLKESKKEEVQIYLMSIKYIEDVLMIFEKCNIYPFYDSVEKLYSKNKRLSRSEYEIKFRFTPHSYTPIEQSDSFIKLKSLIEKRQLGKEIDESISAGVTKKKRL